MLNSYAFALANLGQLDKAEEIIKKIPHNDYPGWYIGRANFGLIQFRRKNYEQAFALYQEAIKGFEEKGDDLLAITARIYLAMEAFHSGHPLGSSLFTEAEELITKHPKSAIAKASLGDVDRDVVSTSSLISLLQQEGNLNS